MNAASEFSSEPLATSTVLTRRLELPNEEVLVVPESLVTGSNKPLALSTPLDGPLPALVNHIKLQELVRLLWFTGWEVNDMFRIHHYPWMIWILYLTVFYSFPVLPLNHNRSYIRVHSPLWWSTITFLIPGVWACVPVPPIVLEHEPLRVLRRYALWLDVYNRIW